MNLMKLNPLFCFLILFVVLVMAGCKVAEEVTNSTASSADKLTPSLTSTVTATVRLRETVTPEDQLPEETSTPAVTPVTPSPPPLQPTNTVVPSATPRHPIVHEPEPLFVCTEPALEFSTRETLEVFSIPHLRFVDEQTLTFEGWAIRPEPTNQNSKVSSILARPFAFQSYSARWLFKAGIVNLSSGEVHSRTLDFLPPYSNPCSGACPHEVIGQSPDEGWQLIQVSDWQETEVGIWLVENSGFISRVVNYVPPFSTWQWAEDSSMLWFDHSVPEYGGRALIVNLESIPITQTVITEADYRLDPTYYSLAFSPIDRTVLSTQLVSTLNDSDELYKFGFEPEMTVISTTMVSDLQYVSWNEATKQYLLTIIKNNELYIFDESGTVLLKVPASTVEVMYPVLSEGNISLKDIFGDGSGYALSPTGQRLAIFTKYNYGQIQVFSCEENI